MTFALDNDEGNDYRFISFSEKPDELEVIEIRPSHSSYELHSTPILDANLGLWLNKNSLDETEAPALLRLVWVPKLRNLQFDTRKSSIDAVLKNFELEEAYRYSFTFPAIFAPIPARQTEHSNTLAFSLGVDADFGGAWKHDVTSGRTEGVFWGHDWVHERMWHIMNKTEEWARHPLFLALVASIMLGNRADQVSNAQDFKINAVENRTRYHGFLNTGAESAEGDYTSLSQRMSGCAGTLALVERNHRIITEFLDDISLCSKRYDVSDDPSLTKIRLEMEDCVETLKRKLKMQKIRLDLQSRRLEIQLTALFHLISQQETRVGIAVAEDSRTLASASKDDSTAMKTIAAVTIVFLPGTFIAALFAMPLFQWDAVGDNKVVSNRFWIYWAVTVPLTFLTLLFWVLWTKRQARMHRSSDKRAREDLWADIEGQRGDGVEKKEV